MYKPLTDELWQLYDAQGRPLAKGATKQESFKKGLLHGAAHIWMWRRNGNNVEVLLQKRGPQKLTWPNYYDVSVAGHILQDEEPLATALREAQEEVGIKVQPADLQLCNVQRMYLEIGEHTENELQWLYLLELPTGTTLKAAAGELAGVEWLPLHEFAMQALHAEDAMYVPHGDLYYGTAIDAIQKAAGQK